MDAQCAPLLALFSMIEPDPVRVSEAVTRARRALDGPASTPDQRVWIRQGIGMALLTVHRSTGDHSALEDAVGELEQARRELTERTSPAIRQKLLWELAEAYRLRDDRERDDTSAAVAAAHASLWVLAEDVLLQLGAEHGLEVARAGASRGLLAAHWAAVDGRIEEAVASLENGRGLVLRAAAAAAGVPEQLAARGEAELAEQWRTAVRDLPLQAAPTGGGLAPGTGGGTPDEVRSALTRVMSAGSAPGVEIPSRLRRRALDVLRRDSGEAPLRGLLGAPGIGELREGLRATGTDALVYLVPGQDTADGVAVLVRSAGEPTALALPGLGAPGRGPLERYLDAGARRSAVSERGMDAHAEAHRHWDAALEGLCDWAGPAVLAPVLDALGARAEDGREKREDRPEQHDAPVRLVLVPCGNLGAVPWHAARLPGPPAGARRPYVYACEDAVISYAASGGEFLRAARRARVPASERAVLVADPSGDLTWAQDEVSALRTAYYTTALLYGWHEDAPENALGTPEDVLSHLPGDPAAPAASLLHLVVHGLAGLRPTDSALHLASTKPRRRPGPRSRPGPGQADGDAHSRRTRGGTGRHRAADRAQCLRDGPQQPRPRRGADPDHRTAGAWRHGCGRLAVEGPGQRVRRADGGLPPPPDRRRTGPAGCPARRPAVDARPRPPSRPRADRPSAGRDAERYGGPGPGRLLGRVHPPGQPRSARTRGRTTAMTTDDLLELLRQDLPEIRASLTAALFSGFRDSVLRLRAAGDDTRAVRAALREMRLALRPLPRENELRRKLDQFRSGGAAPSAVLPDADRLADLIRLLQSVDWPTLDPASAEIARAVRDRLLTTPARGPEQLTGAAAENPAGAGLIRLSDPERGDRYPDFQFDPDTGEPRPVVQRINRMLMSDQDPWGAADWWLGGNTWLRDAPAALVGQVPDARLTEAAAALLGDGGW